MMSYQAGKSYQGEHESSDVAEGRLCKPDIRD